MPPWLFADTHVQVRSDGYRHLGAALGTPEFVGAYVTGKVNAYCKEADKLSKFAHFQPQAVYSTFTHGLRHRWAVVARTVPNTATLLDCTQHSYPDGLYPTQLPCWTVPNTATLLDCTQHSYPAGLYPTQLPCWTVPNTATLLDYTQHSYTAGLYPTQLPC